MRVTLQTHKQGEPLAVRVECNEIATSVAHIDRYIHTLKVARQWFVEQLNGPKPKPTPDLEGPELQDEPAP